MRDRSPASVLLPTVRWTEACDQVAAQLRPGDELFVICDREDDPVADHDPPAGVEILVAGEPEGCSGKANAIACGLERATNDRFVYTDADFDRDDDWLDRLVTAGEDHGPATAVVFYRGDGFWAPMEPWTATFASLSLYLGVGAAGDLVWGGGLTFTREELDVSVAELAADLRRSLADDVLTAQHLDGVHPVRSLVTPVPVPGDARSTYHRLLRLIRQAHVHEGMYGALAVAALGVAGAVVAPLAVALLVTLLAGATYAVLGVRRVTFLLAFPGLFVLLPTILAGMLFSEFEWAGRRYRLNGVRDVDVVGDA